MGLYLNPGNGGFQRALRSKIYVDKTEMISYTNEVLGSEQGYLCVSRPRRFGKSMTANMLCAYYDRDCDSSQIFQSLKISQSPSFKENLNQYDVLFLNMQQILASAGNAELLVSHLQKIVISDLRETYGDIIPVNTSQLSAALTAIYTEESRSKKGFVIIIDEWDCIFRESRENKVAQKAYLDFLKDLLKDRVYVQLAYMTGILPIKKYGTHSALNIFYEFSMTDPKGLASFVGFTEDEVKTLCQNYQMDFEKAQLWYDGYHFARAPHVYNPKSIVDAMLEREFHSYWINTETYEALRIYMDMNYDGLRDAITAMLGGMEQRINPRKFQNDMTSFESRDDVLTLLVHLGYLAYDAQTQTVFIPNLEIKKEFESAVEGANGWETLTSILQSSEALLDATLAKDASAVAAAISAAHSEHVSILSYHDENSLSCVITLAYFSAQKDYRLIRELPAGKGFADIVFLPRHGISKPALIVELKWNQSASGAIAQIKERHYSEALSQYEGDVLLVGINYDKKSKLHQCEIETMSFAHQKRSR